MEYLLTYGWALLVVVIVLAALLYLGVFSVGQRTPEVCTFSPGIICTGFRATNDVHGALTMTLTNGLPTDIYLCDLICDQTLTGPPENVDSCAPPGHAKDFLKSGEQKTVHFPDSQPCWSDGGYAYLVGERYVGKLYLLYSEAGDTGHARFKAGDVITTIQP
ncbi:Uncharacterised protein [Candidatus Burarchaeum australiense]|nr:Uncharacterised protein [Candidatus Burarchaeum australiense]